MLISAWLCDLDFSYLMMRVGRPLRQWISPARGNLDHDYTNAASILILLVLFCMPSGSLFISLPLCVLTEVTLSCSIENHDELLFLIVLTFVFFLSIHAILKYSLNVYNYFQLLIIKVDPRVLMKTLFIRELIQPCLYKMRGSILSHPHFYNFFFANWKE